MNLGKEFNQYATKHMGIKSETLSRFNSSITPYIIEEREMNVTQMDVFSRLMMERVIFLGTGINDQVSNIIQAQLLFLESIDKEAGIQIYINSPGGSVYSGLGIYDTMQYIKPEVSTICTGLAASMAAVLLCAGAEGKRYALPHSRVMIHQPLGGNEGQAKDLEIYVKEMTSVGDDLYEILSIHSGNELSLIKEWCDRDHWMKAESAKDKGFIDQVFTRKNKS
jgi:ATP-dependent Clp protease protease subunit